LISESDLTNSLIKIDAQIKEHNNVLTELNNNIISLKLGEEVISEYNDNFIDITKITTFTQKQKIIKDFIKNIIIEFVDKKSYTINIEYRLPIESETWYTQNATSYEFLKKVIDPNGKITYSLAIAPSIDSPEDNSRFEKGHSKYIPNLGDETE
jgi:uncharacterized protein YbcC (UPF0753/DUF2309 family)